MKRRIVSMFMALILLMTMCLDCTWAKAESTGDGTLETAAIGLATMSSEISEPFCKGALIAAEFENRKEDRRYNFEVVNLENYVYEFDPNNRKVDLFYSMLLMAGSYSHFGICGILSQRLAESVCDYTMSVNMPFVGSLDSDQAMVESIADPGNTLYCMLTNDYILVRENVLKSCQEQGITKMAIIKEDIFSLETITNEMVSASADFGIDIVNVAEPVDYLQNREYYTKLWKEYGVQAVFICVSQYEYYERCLFDYLEQFPDIPKYAFDFYFPGKFDDLPGYIDVCGTDYFDTEVLMNSQEFVAAYRERYHEEPDTYAIAGFSCASTLCWYLTHLEDLLEI